MSSCRHSFSFSKSKTNSPQLTGLRAKPWRRKTYTISASIKDCFKTRFNRYPVNVDKTVYHTEKGLRLRFFCFKLEQFYTLDTRRFSVSGES